MTLVGVVGQHVAAHRNVEHTDGEAAQVGVASVGGRVREGGDRVKGVAHGVPVTVDAEGGAGRPDRLGQHGEDGSRPAADVGDARTGRDAGGRPVLALVLGGPQGHHAVPGQFVLAQRQRIGGSRHGPIYAARPCAVPVTRHGAALRRRVQPYRSMAARAEGM